MDLSSQRHLGGLHRAMY
jgi:hypothetical protein